MTNQSARSNLITFGRIQKIALISDESDAEAFQASEWSLRRERAKIGLLVGAIMMPFGAILDYTQYPESFGMLTAIRFASTLILIAGFWYFLLFQPGKWFAALSLALVLSPAVTFNAMICLTDGGASTYYFGLILLMIVVTLLGFSWPEAMLYCGITIATYLLAVALNQQGFSTNRASLTQGTFFLATNAVLCVLVCHLNRDNRLVFFRLRRQAEAESQKRIRFLAEVSHELRTPLTLISAPLDELLATRNLLSETAGQRLGMMRRNVDRLRLLVDDVLDVVRETSTISKLRKEIIDVREFLEEVVDLAREAAISIGVRLQLTGLTTPLYVTGDRGRLERVLLNLLTNAFKYASEGEHVEVHLNATSDFVLIDVVDDGPGIPEAALEAVFGWEYQASNVAKEITSQGSGLGLAIAQQITRWHGGSIHAENRNPRGACFQVRLPIVTNVDRHTVQSDRTVSISQSPLTPRPAISSHIGESSDLARVLVIDDEADLRSYLRESLGKKYDVEVAINSNEGIRLANQRPPHCILLDLMLPDTRDLQTLQALRASEQLRDTKILMLTANADESIKLEALRSGADDFLGKPFGIAELHARVDVLVQGSRMQCELREQQAKLAKSLKDLQQSEAKLYQSEKMRAIADLAGGLLHEINNPINFSLMAVKVLRRQIESVPECVETVEDLSEGITRIGDIISDLRTFAYPEEAQSHTSFELASALRMSQRFICSSLYDVELRMPSDAEMKVFVTGSQSQIVQVLINLISNAAKAIQRADSDEQGVISVEVNGGRDRVSITIIDNGVGIPAEAMSRIRTPFFTTSEQGGGLGLGLSICESILRQHGSDLNIESTEQVGTVVSFHLPISH